VHAPFQTASAAAPPRIDVSSLESEAAGTQRRGLRTSQHPMTAWARSFAFKHGSSGPDQAPEWSHARRAFVVLGPGGWRCPLRRGPRRPGRVVPCGVDSGFRERAAARRRRGMWGGVARSHDELDERDLDFWLSIQPAERIGAACRLHEEARLLRNDAPFPRLQGSPGGVRRLER
jgi:hypothetical protein